MSFLWFILIGCAAGFIAGKLTSGSGYGIVLNLIIGIVGSILGGVLFNILGIHTSSIIGSLITAVVGAIVLLWIYSWLARKRG
ncbi:MAG: GlsB/YeaQ/YmgE family stress response membrane protein [Muribaculaceae bacterium]|nr:GlsB/YeaQ/YmgE family stress response membrane protein [Muribaculaceae bacterium]